MGDNNDEVTKRRREATLAAFSRMTDAVERFHGKCAVVKYRREQEKRARDKRTSA